MYKLFLISLFCIYSTIFPGIFDKKNTKLLTHKLCFEKGCVNVELKRNTNNLNKTKHSKEKRKEISILETHKNEKKIIAWTKYNTKPMDIIWLDKDYIIIEVLENIPVLKNDIIIPSKTAKHILKMPGGTIQNKMLHLGQKARLFNPNKPASNLSLIAKN